ncbi:protocadherin-23 isoform X1 [Tachysurus vachellii]|uniref:protocadherin-23 isoform X1 n=1 Tax=Tachysurus vachellii TaxID=175792 RepID=UPI00296ADB2E|nr:protocadherin-23 isoform X1 [Tachysurus vachellii]
MEHCLRILLQTFFLLLLLCVKSWAQVYKMSVSVEEGLPVGIRVGDVRAAFPPGLQSSGFFISESTDSDVFRDLKIDSETGVISTSAVLDRERRDRYEFSITSLSGQVVKVHVVVKDVNDHAPVFPEGIVMLNVSEWTQTGTTFHLDAAGDQDEGRFGVQGYRLLESIPEKVFKLNVQSMDLVLVKELDREIVDFYNLTIEAFDGGVPPKNGYLQVNVNILDENDNIPVFDQTDYQAFILENTPILTPVCQVNAHDLDVDSNGLIRYEINRLQSNSGEFFIIDKNTGIISVNKILDYETSSSFELVVMAQDQGSPPKSSSVFVEIKILDVNDNSPNISIVFLSESGAPEVSEGASYGDYVARIIISDPDLGETNKVSVLVKGGEGKFILNSVDAFVYALCVEGALDKEEKDQYTLTIIASDFGSPPLRSERTFVLRISDVNDNAPVFEQKIYESNVFEDAPEGSSVIQVKAHDDDEDSGISYWILQSDQSFLVNIDSLTGIISTAAGLDRERESDLVFLVVAVDSGFPPLTSTATVSIYIEDVNDNSPVFQQQIYNTTIREHLAIGSCFIQVTAEDADGGEFGSVRYDFSDAFNTEYTNNLFHINPVTGEICVSGDIDRDEGLVNVDLLVKAEDQGGLGSQMYLHVDVEDVNDNTPVFNPEKYTTSLSRNTQTGAEILTVFATDRDSGIYGRVSYKLLHGDHTSFFSVNKSSGTLSISSSLSKLSSGTVHLAVSAHDGGGVASPRPADIIVNILNAGHAPALFQKSYYNFSVSEDSPPGTSVGKVQAVKPHDLVDAHMYRISSGNPEGFFSLDSETGVIYTNISLDHESVPSALLTVEAYINTQAIYSTAYVHIIITDINDNPPVFPISFDLITLSHKAVPGTTVYVAHAHDSDSDANGQIRYSLHSESQLFAIHPHFGTLTLKSSITEDTLQKYELNLVAKDKGNPSLSSSMSLMVELDPSVNVKDMLAFETLIYQVEIGENAQSGTRVIQVRAHGIKSQTGSPLARILSYSMDPLSTTLPFLIQPESGWIFVARSLDYESEKMYRFHIRATARGSDEAMSASAIVIISVQDENDNTPVFSRERYFFIVPESLNPHGLMGKLNATDRDSGKNGQLSYILLSDTKHFRIDSKTGGLINWVALDREHQPHHTLRVLVTDHGHPRLNSTTTVYVTVTDINDNPPQFTHKELSLQVCSNLPVGSVIANMFAKDLDAGENGTVTFYLRGDDVIGRFEIDSQSGEIKITTRFDRNHRRRYTIRVVATDNGAAPVEQTAIVHVQVHTCAHVQGHKVGSREFLGLRCLTVREDTGVGSLIGSLGVFRRSSQPLRYTVANGDGSFHFTTDPANGNIYLAKPLDYETNQQYYFEVHPNFNATVLVSVSIDDVNDHTPSFPGNNSIVVFSVQEDVTVGTVVYVFKAIDGDGTLRNSAVCYTLTFDPNFTAEKLPFRIDPDSGAVLTTSLLDRERNQSFAFVVTASDSTHFDSVMAQVFLLDINDNSPTFFSNETVHIAEDTEVGSLLHHFLARDEDEGVNSHVSFSVISGNEAGVFRLERSGHLYLNSSVDYESQHAFGLTVQVSDGGTPSLSSTQTVTVLLVDVNDETPLFEHNLYRASVMENREPGEAVITVRASDLDSGENANISYSLLPGADYEFFSIHSHSGHISTTTRLDRELQHSFILRVQAEDAGIPALSSTTTVLCSVLDVNDNPPEFSQSFLHIVIPENLPSGVIHTAVTFDPDDGINGTVIYSIENTFGDFFINSETGAVSTTNSLDREKRPNYTLLIKAADQGFASLTSTATLSISLSDENDNSPAFDRTSYRAIVSEDLPLGSEILRLIARDPDEGQNAEVTFSLIEEESGTFSVDSLTGAVHLMKPLDREIQSQYNLRAVATDACSQGPRSSVVIVSVEVEDVNDNMPYCINDPIRASASAGFNQIVAMVAAHDPDQGENGTVVFRLTEEDEQFQIDQWTGEVQTKSPMRANVPGTKVLKVWATDLGSPALTSTCLVIITLNGDEPLLQFTVKHYEVSLPENSLTGTWVGNVVAHDQSATEVTAKYSIFSGNENGAFSIDANTGDITIRDQHLLDFEREHEFHLVVLAENGRHSSHARVTVTLQDLNDNAPVFKQSYYRTAVWEGQIPNTYVMQVLAVDADSGVNGQIDYTIVDGNRNNAFIIDSIRGILATSAVLDRELVSSYKLIVEAKDRGNPALTETCTVQVQVVDINDNSPVIQAVEPLLVPENYPPGHIIFQVMASDADLHSSITYSLAQTEKPNDSFAIDFYSGIITSIKSLDYEDQILHTLTVVASDSVHQMEAQITIKVLDVNDNAPVFSQEFYQVVLPELTPADVFVVAVSATDRDSGLNGKISYRLLSSTKAGFYISHENGSIYTSKPLKHADDSSIIRLLVEARDGGDPSLSSVTSVDIEVQDFNDHAPFFQHSTYQVSVCEDTPVGNVLLTLLAQDQDYSEENTHLDYTITGGNEKRHFCIEAAVVPTEFQKSFVGYLVLCDTLDRETTETYLLTVTVMDRGVPRLNSSTIVSVMVLDINDNEPVFSSLEYHVQASENNQLSTFLVLVSAQDLDLGPNGTVRYDIISGNSKGLFQLNYQTGTLEASGTLDYEDESKHILTIQASDGGDPDNRKLSFAVIFITVLDENDHLPFFRFPTINCSVAENLPAFTPVCMVHAIDQDAGSFGLLTYSILTSCFMDYGNVNQDMNEAFTIDPLTGEIHTKQIFDYERVNEYCFVVEAIDKGDQAAMVRVQVDVEGVDEFSPVFTQKLYDFTLPDNSIVGQIIGYVTAMDYDKGIDGIVEYNLAKPSLFFSVNKNTGSIYISNPVYHRRGNIATSEAVEDFLIQASSPKLDSRSTICRVVVDISNSAEALTSVAVRVQAVSLSVSLAVSLLLIISIIALILRYKTKKNELRKTANVSLASNVKGSPITYNETFGLIQDIRGKNDPFRNSGSSGRGSAEGETTEDVMSEYQCLKQPDAVMTEPELGIPLDRISCNSVETYLGKRQMVGMPSVESLYNFKEEGGGEGMLPHMVNMMEMDEVIRSYQNIEHQNIIKGSFSNLVYPEMHLCGKYNWDKPGNWKPYFQFQPTIFANRSMLLEKEPMEGDINMELHNLLHLPPQPNLHNLTSRIPQTIETSGKKLFNSKYKYSCLPRNPGLNNFAMTSDLSPSSSLLTLRTTNASPVVSETGLGSVTKIASPPEDVLDDADI